MTVLNQANALYLGGSQASAAYLGPTRVYPAFTPDQIVNIMVWLDGSWLSGANGAPISRWSDNGPFNRPALQSTPAQQPVIVTNGLAGKRIARFDGVDDNLVVSTWTWPQRYTVFAVARAAGPILNAGLDPDQQFGLAQTGGVATATTYDSVGDVFQDTTPAADGAWHRLTVRRQSTSVEVWVGGVSNGPSPTTGSAISSDASLYFGTGIYAGSPAALDLAAFIAYDRALTDTERVNVDGYLAAAWGIS